MLTVFIPDPHRFSGSATKEIYGDTASELARNARDWITECAYGSSEIGAVYLVHRDGKAVGNLYYNGRLNFNQKLDPKDAVGNGFNWKTGYASLNRDVEFEKDCESLVQFEVLS